ncbi:hypothetical protein NC99_03800 [Sunxiuqinia dokdonensis]|uniref:Uncharacterized protein n=1 Tax=Sunxiuqinia dokdonensis TaxID=1409788 RepID=A0A0L8VEA9_9BACT|nr:hypothetical protein NC99_03800 [Sunxiuqinia dokdonensis]
MTDSSQTEQQKHTRQYNLSHRILYHKSANKRERNRTPRAQFEAIQLIF